MPRILPFPRKRRTRQHAIADLSVNFVERFILQEGHTAQRVQMDYGYDVILTTYDREGYIEPGLAYLQMKAVENLKRSGNGFVFDLDVRDYHLWLLERFPVFLVLFDASRRKGYWFYVQKYFQEDASRQPRQGARTVRIRVPQRQPIGCRAIARMREHKLALL